MHFPKVYSNVIPPPAVSNRVASAKQDATFPLIYALSLLFQTELFDNHLNALRLKKTLLGQLHISQLLRN